MPGDTINHMYRHQKETLAKRPMKVLHFLNALPGAGCGIVNAAIDIISGQARQGLEVAVCSGGGEVAELLHRHSIPHFNLLQTRTPQALVKSVAGFHNIVHQFEPDIVHCHMVANVLIARLVRVFHSYKIVAHLHNVHQRSSDLMRLADRVIAVSDAVGVDMEKRGIPRKRLRVVLNGTLNSFRNEAAFQAPPQRLSHPAIVTVAGLNHRKGISELITAFERVAAIVPQAHLYLVGNGPDRETFKSQASASPFKSNIHFEGFQPNPVSYMRAADVFVLASRRDSFGLVLSEARECGCAIVATNVDGIPEALDDGRAGVLVPPMDVAALSTAILGVLTNSQEQRRLAEAARQQLDRFTVDRVARDLSIVYSELVTCSIVQAFAPSSATVPEAQSRLSS